MSTKEMNTVQDSKNPITDKITKHIEASSVKENTLAPIADDLVRNTPSATTHTAVVNCRFLACRVEPSLNSAMACDPFVLGTKLTVADGNAEDFFTVIKPIRGYVKKEFVDILM